MTCGDRECQAPAGCAQCGTVGPLTPSDHGLLCAVCAFVQAERDEARDTFAHLSARSFGFLYEDE